MSARSAKASAEALGAASPACARKPKAVAYGDVCGSVKLKTVIEKGSTSGGRPAAVTVMAPPPKVPLGARDGAKKSTQKPRL
jgi:hypothetical protein